MARLFCAVAAKLQIQIRLWCVCVSLMFCFVLCVCVCVCVAVWRACMCGLNQKSGSGFIFKLLVTMVSVIVSHPEARGVSKKKLWPLLDYM